MLDECAKERLESYNLHKGRNSASVNQRAIASQSAGHQLQTCNCVMYRNFSASSSSSSSSSSSPSLPPPSAANSSSSNVFIEQPAETSSSQLLRNSASSARLSPLESLPAEALANIVSDLSVSERRSLLRSSPIFHRAFRPHSALWRDVYATRFQSRALNAYPSHANRILSKLTPYTLLRLRDSADAYMCYRSAWRSVYPTQSSLRITSSASTSSPHARVHADISKDARYLLIAYGNVLSRQLISCGDIPNPFANEDIALPFQNATALAPCGSSGVLVAGDCAVTHVPSLTQITSGKRTVPSRLFRGHSSVVRSVVHIPTYSSSVIANGHTGVNGVLAAGGDDGSIRLHRLSTRRSAGVLRGHGGSVRELRALMPYSDDNDNDTANSITSSVHHLLSHAATCVRIWDIERSRVTFSLRDSLNFAVDRSDQCTLYTVSTSGEYVRVHDMRARALAATLSIPSSARSRGGIRALHVRNGTLAAAVGSGGIVTWDAKGPWNGRLQGMPTRYGTTEHRALKSVKIGTNVTVATGGAGVLLVFGKKEFYRQLPADIGRNTTQLLLCNVSARRGNSEMLFVVANDAVSKLDIHSERAKLDVRAACAAAGFRNLLRERHFAKTETSLPSSRFWRTIHNSEDEDESGDEYDAMNFMETGEERPP